MDIEEWRSDVATFGKDVSPPPPIGCQFDGDLRRIERVDQSPSGFHLARTRVESERSLVRIVFTRRSGAPNNNPRTQSTSLQNNSNQNPIIRNQNSNNKRNRPVNPFLQ